VGGRGHVQAAVIFPEQSDGSYWLLT
jgi:hypothetical protein